MLYGLGFPPFHGGPLKWVDTVGVATFVEICDRYADLGELYKPTEGLRKMAEEGRTFF